MSEYAYFFGFSHWKRGYMKPFFPEFEMIHFCSTLEEALKRGLSPECGTVAIWGKKPFDAVVSYAERHNIPLLRVEDGFIRSVGLGSDLTRPYSLVVDKRGIYFDPSQESDLEYILNHHRFDDLLLARARALIKMLIEKKISKYNVSKATHLHLPGYRSKQRIILVPGQVEDDASILYGASGMKNIELLEQVRQKAPDAYVIYKPHPDVVAGNRRGAVSKAEAMQYCDTVVTDIPIGMVLEAADEVHTMTSLVGFEALIRQKSVYTYGMPFYAGWGLTMDMKACSRRTRCLNIEEMAAAVLLCYPRYLSLEDERLCDAEVTLVQIDQEKNRYNRSFWYRWRRDLYALISRKIQLLLRIAKGEISC
jgi:capsular polysaccharide export protein